MTSNNPGPNNPHTQKKKKKKEVASTLGFRWRVDLFQLHTFLRNSVHLYSNADKNQIIDQKSHTHIPGNLQGITTDDEAEARPEGWHTFFALREPSHVISQLRVQREKSDVTYTTYNIIYNYAFQLLFFFCFVFFSLHLHISPSFFFFMEYICRPQTIQWNTHTPAHL